MSEQLITEHIDLWSSAILAKSSAGRGGNKRYELYGIKKLRELILELAVRGKLVPQDPNDEPASVLLKKIAAEKAQLIKDGKIKKTKPLPKITEDEVPFELPKGWEWGRLGEIASYGNQFKAEAKTVKLDTWVLELEDIEKETSRLLNKVRFSERKFKSTKNVFEKHTVLYGKLRPYLDKVIVSDESGVCTTEIIPITCYAKLSPYYLRYTLKNPSFIEYANSSTHGMNLPRLGTEKAIVSLIPLPPLAEQHRIVAKVDELMGLCDQLEQESEARIEAHEQLVEQLLTTLSDSADASDLADNWARISEHFDTLFTSEKSIDALKQTVLQLAVMGKLVPQNPNDEPAALLLKKIAAEKAKLVKDGKIKKQKPLPPITDDEKPFELPNGWEWVRLQNLSSYIQRGKGPSYATNGKVRVVSQKCIQWKGFDISVSRYIADTSLIAYQKERYLQNLDLLWNSTGTGTVGRINTLLNVEQNTLVADSHVTVIRPIRVNNRFIELYISSSLVQKRFEPDHENSLVSGSTKQVELNTSVVVLFLIPLPPLAEQQRIVAKVDELMGLCDRLKAGLQAARETQVKLTDAIVDQAL